MKKIDTAIICLVVSLILSSVIAATNSENVFIFVLNFCVTIYAAFVLGKSVLLRKVLKDDEEIELFYKNLLTQSCLSEEKTFNEQSCRKQCSKRCNEK